MTFGYLLVIAFQNSCNGIYKDTNTTIVDIANCGIGTLFGLDYTIFGFFILLAIGLMHYYLRMPQILSLGFGFAMSYMIDMAGGGGNYFLQVLMVLFALGLVVSIVRGVLDYAGSNSY